MHEEQSLLLQGGHVLCLDEAGTQFRRGHVLIRGERIETVGEGEYLDPSGGGFSRRRDPSLPATKVSSTGEFDIIDCSGCVVMPGLINCHTHLPMVYFRGLADDLPLDVWLREYIWPAESRQLNPDMVYRATQLAAAECIRGGTTCVNDMYLFEHSVAQALADCGLRGLVGEGVLSFPTPSASGPEEGIALTEKLLSDWGGHPLITPTVAPHAPYTCSAELLHSLSAIARGAEAPLHIHLHETHSEPGMIRWREGEESPAESLARIGVLGGQCVCAHCVHLRQRDLALMAASGASVAHCPQSNLKLASGIAALREMLEAGMDVGVGTDGAASNNNLSIWEEVQLAALLAKGGRELNATAVPARTALELATRRAARTLKQPEIGTLAAGMLADIIVVDMQATHLTPLYPGDHATYSHLAYSAQASDVRDTIVHGKVLMRERKLLTLDEGQVMRDAREWLGRDS